MTAEEHLKAGIEIAQGDCRASGDSGIAPAVRRGLTAPHSHCSFRRETPAELLQGYWELELSRRLRPTWWQRGRRWLRGGRPTLMRLRCSIWRLWAWRKRIWCEVFGHATPEFPLGFNRVAYHETKCHRCGIVFCWRDGEFWEMWGPMSCCARAGQCAGCCTGSGAAAKRHWFGALCEDRLRYR